MLTSFLAMLNGSHVIGRWFLRELFSLNVLFGGPGDSYVWDNSNPILSLIRGISPPYFHMSPIRGILPSYPHLWAYLRGYNGITPFQKNPLDSKGLGNLLDLAPLNLDLALAFKLYCQGLNSNMSSSLTPPSIPHVVFNANNDDEDIDIDGAFLR